MSETAAWFAKHLGLQQPQQQPQQAPQQFVQPQYPQQPQQWQQQQPQQPQQVPVVLDANGNPVVNAMTAAASWQGTRAAQADSGICPDCGSSNYFKREALKMKRTANGAHPSAICMDCGSNGIFDQQMGVSMVDTKAPVWDGRPDPNGPTWDPNGRPIGRIS